jgi:hypothetical protein
LSNPNLPDLNYALNRVMDCLRNEECLAQAKAAARGSREYFEFLGRVLARLMDLMPGPWTAPDFEPPRTEETPPR